jgi:NADH-quinone oxidoreductase subunit I
MFGFLKGFKLTLGYFFKKKVTIMYPEERPVMAERFRGIQRIIPERCIVCNMCVKACPTEVITLTGERDPETKKNRLLTYNINFERCIRCEFCAEVCPTSAVVFTTKYDNLSVYDRKALQKDITWLSANKVYGNYESEDEEGRPAELVKEAKTVAKKPATTKAAVTKADEKPKTDVKSEVITKAKTDVKSETDSKPEVETAGGDDK